MKGGRKHEKIWTSGARHHSRHNVGGESWTNDRTCHIRGDCFFQFSLLEKESIDVCKSVLDDRVGLQFDQLGFEYTGIHWNHRVDRDVLCVAEVE